MGFAPAKCCETSESPETSRCVVAPGSVHPALPEGQAVLTTIALRRLPGSPLGCVMGLAMGRNVFPQPAQNTAAAVSVNKMSKNRPEHGTLFIDPTLQFCI